MLFGMVFVGAMIFLYLLLYKAIPGSGWLKGFYFGLIIGFIKAVPEAFNQFMMFKYPVIMIFVQLFNTMVGLILFGILLAVVFQKFNVIQAVN